VYLAAVGDLAGDLGHLLADGMLVHPFTTERYLREVTIPAIERGMAKAGRTRENSDFELSLPAFVVTGANEGEREAATGLVKSQVSFYGSTPAYRGVLELHGWGDLQTELNGLSKQGQWGEMAKRIDDEIMAAFSIDAELDEVAPKVLERFGGVVDRVSFYGNLTSDAEKKSEIVAALQKG
jgi:probable F420-dependent oxidoreductase